MDIKDLFVTPLFLILFMIGAYIARPFYTDSATRKYFLPAISLKFFGAISLGLVYQFYYGGGDTFNYFHNGSRWIWEAFLEKPNSGLRLLLAEGGKHTPDLFEYSQYIWYYDDPKSYFIVRITSFWDLFTFHTYSATALFFSLWSFIGSWSLFSVFNRIYPDEKKWLAIAILFVPSVVFWGSGILKDSVTFGALGVATYGFYQIFYFREKILKSTLIAFFALWVIYSIKIYILLSFIVGIFVWLYSLNINKIKSPIVKTVIAPLFIALFAAGGYLLLDYISANDSRYALDKIANTAAVTANDIRYGWGARTGDTSGYDLGKLDGTFGSMIRLAPAAVNVSLFRPYLWEVKNPLMLLSSLEANALFFFTVYFLYKSRKSLRSKLSDPNLRFALMFSIFFAFAVGISTYNFGTLMRYKIPMMPYYLIGIILLSRQK